MFHHRRHKARNLFDGFALAVVSNKERGHGDIRNIAGHDLIHRPCRSRTVHVAVVHETDDEVRPVAYILHDAAFVSGEGNGHS